MSRASKKSASVVWQDRLDRFEESGQTVVAFCTAEGVSEASFYSWRKRLAGASRQRSQPNKPVFQAVQIRSAVAVLSIELPGGARLEVPVWRCPRIIWNWSARWCGKSPAFGQRTTREVRDAPGRCSRPHLRLHQSSGSS